MIWLSVLAAWAVVGLHAHGVRPFAALTRFIRQSFVGLMLSLTFAVGMFYIGATKPPSGGAMMCRMPQGVAQDGMAVTCAGGPFSADFSALFGCCTNEVTNLCFLGIQRITNMVWMGVAWPTNEFPQCPQFDFYALDDLTRNDETNAWTLLGRAQAEGDSGAMAVGIDSETLPWDASVKSFFKFALPTDADGDGLSDVYEELVSRTDPSNTDTDADGMPDGWEVLYGLDPFTNDSSADGDDDGLSNAEEFRRGTDPGNPDTDGDGLTDFEEVGLPAEEVTYSPFTAGASLTNLTREAAFTSTGRVDCVDVPLAEPIVLAGSAYDRLTLDPNGVIYLRPTNSTGTIASCAFPDDYADVLSRVNDCVLMPYWSRLVCTTNGANASDVRIECTNGVTLITYENMRFDPSGVMDMVPAMLRPMVPMLVQMTPVSFQVEIDPSRSAVTYRYRLGTGSNGLLDSVTTGRLAGVGAQGRFMGTSVDWGFGDSDALASGMGLVLTLATGTDPANADTDGDGMSDVAELASGRNPKDNTDAEGSDEASIFLVFGDPSWTHSESYRVEITPIVSAPLAHVPESRHYETQAGQLWRTSVPLERGWQYEVRMFHIDTTLTDGADYDYLIGFGSLSSLIEVSDPDGLRACHIYENKTGDYSANGKVAVITVLGKKGNALVSFDKSAVIFEDAHLESPGQTVARRSTGVNLSCTAYGGDNGGTVTFSVDNLGKLTSDGSVSLPITRTLEPNEVFGVVIALEGAQASASEGDIVARAEFVDALSGEHLIGEPSALTSIKLELQAVYTAPANPCMNRHTYGVGEKVRFIVSPQLSVVGVSTEKQDGTYDGPLYELFDGVEETDASVVRTYVCPISANYVPPIRIVYDDVEYRPCLSLVEPQYVVTKGADWGENRVDIFYSGNRKCWPSGMVGAATLVTTNCIGPMNVSFQGIAVSELPCSDEDVVTGCFANGHARTHTVNAGAGRAYYIGPGNFWFVDSAGQSAPEPNWTPNSTLNWKIPLGWHRKDPQYDDYHGVVTPDYEVGYDAQSRPLIIGQDYRQCHFIDQSGTFRIDKYGHWISRSVSCEVILDGRIMQESHP